MLQQIPNQNPEADLNNVLGSIIIYSMKMQLVFS